MQENIVNNDTNVTYQWYKWNSASELETKGSWYTDESSYTGDGYIQDYSLGINSEEFIQEIQELFTVKPAFIDFSTAVIIISFNCYEPSQDRFIATQMTIEFSLAGLLVPKPIKIICFSLDQLKQTASSAIVVDGF